MNQKPPSLAHLLDAICPLLYQIQDLIELGREQVKCSKDAAVRTEVVPFYNTSSIRHPCKGREKTRYELLHYFLVVDGIPNVDIGFVRHICHSRIEIENVWG